MIKEKLKSLFYLYIAMIIATLLGVYGQSITYYIYENIAKISLEYCITVITMISISLFILPPILIFKSNRKDGITNKKFDIYYIINIMIGGTTSTFSLFVMIMWWG